jgi:hypothetical protein
VVKWLFGSLRRVLGTDKELLIGESQRWRQTQDTGVCVLATKERRVERVACVVCVPAAEVSRGEHCQLWTVVCVCVCVCACVCACGVCVCVSLCGFKRGEQLGAGHRLAFKYNVPQTMSMYYPPAWNNMRDSKSLSVFVYVHTHTPPTHLLCVCTHIHTTTHTPLPGHDMRASKCLSLCVYVHTHTHTHSPLSHSPAWNDIGTSRCLSVCVHACN